MKISNKNNQYGNNNTRIRGFSEILDTQEAIMLLSRNTDGRLACTSFNTLCDKYLARQRFEIEAAKPLTEKQIENILYLCQHGKYPKDKKLEESITHIFNIIIDLDKFILNYDR